MTQLRRWDGTRIWYPNTKLASEAVHNISRSGLRWEGFKVSHSAPRAVLLQDRQRTHAP